jgi:hypothetical protein
MTLICSRLHCIGKIYVKKTAMHSRTTLALGIDKRKWMKGLLRKLCDTVDICEILV